MNQPLVEILFRLDKTEADRALADFKDTVKDSVLGAGALAATGATAAQALIGAVGALRDFVADGIRESSAQEAAERKMAAALRIRGEATDDAVDRLKAFNAVAESKYAIDERELLQLQSKLTLMGVSRVELEEATRATIGLAEATGGDLAGAATTVAKAYAGHLEALKKLGFEATTTSGAIAQLASFSEAAAERAAGFEGAIFRAEDAVGDLGRELGTLVRQNPMVTAAIESGGGLMGWLATQAAQAARDQAEFNRWLKDLESHRGILQVLGDFFRIPPEDRVPRKGPLFFRDPALTKGGESSGIGELRLRDDAAVVEERAKIDAANLRAFEEGNARAAELYKEDERRRKAQASLAREAASEARARLAEMQREDRQREQLESQWAANQRARVEEEETRVERLKALREDELRARAEWAAKLSTVTRAEDSEQQRYVRNGARARDEMAASIAEWATDVGASLAGASGSLREFAVLRTEFVALSQELVGAAVDGTAQMVAGMAAAIGEGGEAVLASAGQLFGSLLQTMGEALIKEGLALLFLAPVTGGATAALGAGLTLAGAILVGGGAAIAASATPASPEREARAPRSSASRRTGSASDSGARPADITNVYHITFDRGVVMGTPTQVGRAIEDALGRAQRLRPGGR